LVIRQKKESKKNQHAMESTTCGKYHNFGNSFILLDETQKIMVPEPEKKRYAIRILNPDTGIGADGMIVLSTPGIWQAKDRQQDKKNIDGTFRYFAPDGSESLMCLNGLLVSGLYFAKIFDKPIFNVLAATNDQFTQRLCIGVENNQAAFVDGMQTTRVDKSLADPGVILPFLPGIDKITPLKINFRRNDINGLDIINSCIHLSGYLVFSGEPHLVVFTDQMEDQHGLTELIFHSPTVNRRSSLGDRLVHAIGMRLQHDFKHFFPRGLNLTFIHLSQEPGAPVPLIEYRCFERAINKETLSCGTAALACASVVQALNLAQIEKTPVYPYLYNRYHPDSFYNITPHTQEQNLWKITGNPELISPKICFL
jgi:diaminopimelate epimerase